MKILDLSNTTVGVENPMHTSIKGILNDSKVKDLAWKAAAKIFSTIHLSMQEKQEKDMGRSNTMKK